MAQTNDSMVAALLRERAGYRARGLDDRVAQVDQQLAARGVEPPADRPPPDGGPPPERTAPERQTADGSQGERVTEEPAAPPKRGRGRPRKTGADGG